jgi:hypothetical protein
MAKAPEPASSRPLLDKLGVRPGARVAVIDLDDPSFMSLLAERTGDITTRKPRAPCDIVFFGVRKMADLRRLVELKTWIEPNGAVWVIRPKGPASPIKDLDLIQAGLGAGLVDNKIASFSDTRGAMRFVYRLRDRPR